MILLANVTLINLIEIYKIILKKRNVHIKTFSQEKSICFLSISWTNPHWGQCRIPSTSLLQSASSVML